MAAGCLLLSGCGALSKTAGSGQTDTGGSSLSASTTNLSFGNIQAGESSTQSVTLSSTGTSPVTISAITVTGPGFAASGVTTPTTLNPGQTATVALQFTAPLANKYTGTLTIVNNSSQGNLAINMSAAVVAETAVSNMTCNSASMTGAGSDACTVNLTGAAPAGGLAVGLSSSNAAVSVPPSVTVAANTTSATFTASAVSVSSAQMATLTASTNSIVATLGIQLNAATPALSASATTVSFGNVQTGQIATQSVTLTSTGTAPVTITGISVTGSLFSASGITIPSTLNPGQKASLTLQVTPSQASNYTGALTIASNSAQGNLVVNMSAVGVAMPAVSKLSCNSSSLTGSGSDACIVTLTSAASSGGLAVSLVSSNSAVTVPASITVPANATTASFTATVGSVTSSQTATITANGGGTSGSVAIQLAPPAATLSVNASSVSFGNVCVNCTATQSITLSATGTVSVTVNSVSISGTGFTISGLTFPLTLNAGQTATLNVQYEPTAVGSGTGQLTISSNSAENGTIAIGLSGAGFTYSVNLSWNAPSSSGDPVAGYIVYRATQGSTTFVRLNSSVATQTAYTDTSVQNNSSYEYYVTSIDSSGNQSAPSNDTSVSIP
jgi:hypothetical protein